MYRLLLALINGQIISLHSKDFICATKHIVVLNPLH